LVNKGLKLVENERKLVKNGKKCQTLAKIGQKRGEIWFLRWAAESLREAASLQWGGGGGSCPPAQSENYDRPTVDYGRFAAEIWSAVRPSGDL